MWLKLAFSLLLVSILVSARTPFINRPVAHRNAKPVAPVIPQLRAEACCGTLGCFSNEQPFHDIINRPLSSIPNCNVASRIKFYLNTRTNKASAQLITPEDRSTLTGSAFDPALKTKILIHGFLDHYAWPWWDTLKNELLTYENVNVIRVDWSLANTAPYTQATANSRLTGARTAELINALREQYNYDPINIHIIGHSLGAQASGYAGERIKDVNNKPGIARITGLDPAGPYFTNMATQVRLDITDAKLVDTIVTDMGSIFGLQMGSDQPMGHLNFFPNGGISQPGCDNGVLGVITNGASINTTSFDLIGTIAATVGDAAACSHMRALPLLIDSIKHSGCAMTGYQCKNYADFKAGKCFSCAGNKCTPMGYHVNTALASQWAVKNFYLDTADRQPFCVRPFLFEFKLQTGGNSKPKFGIANIVIHGSKASSEKISLGTDLMDFLPGETYKFMVHTPVDVGVVQSVVFNWDARINLLNPLEWVRKHYLYMDGNMQLTDGVQTATLLRPSKTEILEETDTLAIRA